MRIRSVLTHAVQALAEGALISLLVVGLMAGTAFAARGGASKPNGGGTLSGPEMVTDTNGNGLPNYMDSITFTVSTTSANQLTVGVRCWQGANFVYDAYVGYFAGAWFATDFTLDSSYWTPSLDATCTARLFYYSNRGTERILATTDFGVAP